jgi:uncharacterized protein YbcI
MNDNYFQNEIASHIGKMLRDAFGKGPQSIYVSVDRPFITVYLRNFLTPTEKILLGQGQISAIRHTRMIVMSSLIPEIKAYLQVLTGMNHLDFYYDWELHNRSGIFVGCQFDDLSLSSIPEESYIGKEELHREIGSMSQRIQKWPDSITSHMLNKRTLLIIRTGILIDLSKELIRLRDEELLKEAVITLEKKALQHNNQVEQLLNTKVADVFLDWDLGRDLSVIAYILNPKA